MEGRPLRSSDAEPSKLVRPALRHAAITRFRPQTTRMGINVTIDRRTAGYPISARPQCDLAKSIAVRLFMK